MLKALGVMREVLDRAGPQATQDICRELPGVHPLLRQAALFHPLPPLARGIVALATVAGAPPSFILANHNELPTPEKPLVEFVSHTATTKFAVDPQSNGDILPIGLFGDEPPMTAAPDSPTVGRALVLARTTDWQQHALTTEEIKRPIDIRYNPVDGSMWVVDFGTFEMAQRSSGVEVIADKTSGCIWRVENRPGFPAGNRGSCSPTGHDQSSWTAC